jgi:hypothetical protein
MPKSGEVVAAKYTMPLVGTIGTLLTLWDSADLQRVFARLLVSVIFWAPAAWQIFVPVELEPDSSEEFITVIWYLSRIRVSHDEIDYVKRGFSIFNILRLKNGKRLIYIQDAQNRHLTTPPHPAANIL